MVHSPSRRHPSRLTRWRANPGGVGRLLTVAATLALITMGTGMLWWLGLFLMALILLAVGQTKSPWRKLWPLLAILAAFSFSHLHIIPLWTGITFVILAAVPWTLGLFL